MSSDNVIPMKDPTTYIDFEECLALEEATDSLRDRLVIALLWRCGLRSFEVGRIRKIDFFLNPIVPEDSYLRVFGKGDRQDIIPMSLDIIPMIDEYLKTLTGEYAFPSNLDGRGISRRTVFNILRKAMKTSNIQFDKGGKLIHPHTLRHSLAIFLVKMGMPLPKIQQILRHSSLNPTTYYLRFSTKERSEAYHEAFNKKLESMNNDFSKKFKEVFE